MIRIWLDDIRAPNDHGCIGWVRAKTADEAIDLLKDNDVYQISLDHDLGMEATLGNPPVERTGYDVMLWIEEQVASNPQYKLPIMHIHTANPSARIKMELARDAIKQRHYAKHHPPMEE